MKLYVGNLSFEATENDLQDLFETHGQVTNVTLINDKITGRSRGFAFLTMGDAASGNAAMGTLNGSQLQGRTLTVSEARAREESPRPEQKSGMRRFAGFRQ